MVGREPALVANFTAVSAAIAVSKVITEFTDFTPGQDDAITGLVLVVGAGLAAAWSRRRTVPLTP